ncbi:ABC transporter permease [Streptomyces lincolnensis]|uniref:Putative ABC transporter transmembrane protein n=1 Tax=Streptomyces lincolnensis TaxID=1915 RepID=A0A1B1MM51_STRLN|nr:ABC transporter permease [Streptomyces lincolnensis]ANS69676.1 putative ABC transporter transmembrane protein [Streptomyces lincolnensis]AXG58595.1 putative ABC transporter transmembrane protein [Streptomyces lincolnensis]QMV11227.1 ABC transporter permease [Streptomyces lincolnensis]
MSTLTAIPETPETAPVRPAYRVTGRRVLRAEWAKLWSLRSTWITLGLALVFLVAVGAIAAVQYESQVSGGQQPGEDFVGATSVSLALFGVNFAKIALGVLGVLVTAGEYSTGMIRSTLAAVPRRLPVLWSKAAMFGLVSLVVGTVGVFVAFLFTGAIVSGTPAAVGISDAGVVRSLLGAGLYLGLVGVLGAALGALLRSVAGGISVLVGALMMVSLLLSLVPSSWQDNVGKYLPDAAGESIFALTHDASTLSPTGGLLVFVGWTALALAGAAYRLVRRDV